MGCIPCWWAKALHNFCECSFSENKRERTNAEDAENEHADEDDDIPPKIRPH